MSGATGSLRVPAFIPPNNRHQNQQQQFVSIMPQLDERHPEMNTGIINRLYSNLMSKEDVPCSHGGPECYVQRLGTYSMQSNRQNTFPDNLGHNDKGKPNRCRTCHRLLAPHDPAIPHQGLMKFPCANACALALDNPHVPHPGVVCNTSLLTSSTTGLVFSLALNCT